MPWEKTPHTPPLALKSEHAIEEPRIRPRNHAWDKYYKPPG